MMIQSKTNNHLSISKSQIRHLFDGIRPSLDGINNHLAFGTSTTVVSALQIAHFMQNKPNFQKAKFYATYEMTSVYEQKDTWWSGKNKPNSNPIQTQSNPIKANKMPKQTQFKPNTNQISEAKKCSAEQSQQKVVPR